jgi:hypothetical protein
LKIGGILNDGVLTKSKLKNQRKSQKVLRMGFWIFWEFEIFDLFSIFWYLFWIWDFHFSTLRANPYKLPDGNLFNF